MPRAKKYHTAEERREGARQSYRKYFTANREAIYARRAKRAKREQAAIEAVQKGPSAPNPQGELEDPRASGNETTDVRRSHSRSSCD